MEGHLCEAKTKGVPAQYPVVHLIIPCPLET